MKNLIPLTNQRLENIQKHPFFYWLQDSTRPYDDKFSFVPAMTFFVMGLQDFYKEFLSHSKLQDERDKTLKDYCLENVHAANIYLEDLEQLGFTGHSWGGPIKEVFKKTWSEKNEHSRKYIYQLHHYLQYNNTDENIFMFALIHDQLFILMDLLANISSGQPISKDLGFFNFKNEAIWPKGCLDLESLVSHQLTSQSYYRCYEILDSLDRLYSIILNQWLEQKDDFKRSILIGESKIFANQDFNKNVLQ